MRNARLLALLFIGILVVFARPAAADQIVTFHIQFANRCRQFSIRSNDVPNRAIFYRVGTLAR